MTATSRWTRIAALLVALGLAPTPARAAEPPTRTGATGAARLVPARDDPPADAAAQPAAAADDDDDEDEILDPTQPDFTLVNLPTALRLPRFKSAFRVTHRFQRPLGSGDLGDLAADFFGFDTGAQIGLEYRFGLMRGTQGGIYRTSNRTIQFFLQHDVLRQQGRRPLGITALAVAEGTNNFRDRYSPGLGLILSRTVGDTAALYVEPIWVNNSNPLPEELIEHNSTLLIGIGGRFRIRPTLYVVAEVTPRVSGYRGEPATSTNLIAFALEKRSGGHLFQVNVSDGIASTFANVARGGTLAADGSRDWYIGFNISRKFY